MPKRIVRLREHVPLLDIASYGRRTPAHSIRLDRSQLQQIERTLRRVPEVIVKVSGGGRSVAAVRAHLKYIVRHGRLAIETDEGERLQGRGIEKELLRDWALDFDAVGARARYSGAPGRKPTKVVHNIVLSMPAGTSPDKLLLAAKHFARENFALKNRYAMVLHTDQGHPHVHLVVKAIGEDGNRLNIRKVTLREWREDFAAALRQHGVEANATDRFVRGRPNIRKLDGIHRAARRGASTHLLGRIQSVARDLAQGRLSIEPGRQKLLQSRRDVIQGWQAVRTVLSRDGRADLVARLDRFLKDIPPPRTERELIAAHLRFRERSAHLPTPSR